MVTISYSVARWTSKGKLKVTQGTFQVPRKTTWDQVVERLNVLMVKQYSRFTLTGWSSSHSLIE